jgi:BASS family bile acid:Na+ symporter
MYWLKLPTEALGRIGRHGTSVVATSVFIGLAIPPLAAVLKPLLGPVIVLLLTLAFLRVDPAELRRYFVRPKLIAAATLWVMVICPLALGALFLGLGLPHRSPGLHFILVLQICATATMSSPAMAALLGLDVALTLGSLIVAMVISPLTAALFTHLLLGTSVISPVGFGLKLVLIIGGSALAAALTRHFAGRERLERGREQIDGLSVLSMVLFAIAAMDGVTAHAIADPLLVAGLTVLAFVIALGLIAITTLIFLPAGRHRALAVGLTAGSRNIGLMLTAIGFAVPDISWLYFALAQLPIYMLPHLLKPLARRLAPPEPALRRPGAA